MEYIRGNMCNGRKWKFGRIRKDYGDEVHVDTYQPWIRNKHICYAIFMVKWSQLWAVTPVKLCLNCIF
jgi:hypothetical protein